MHTDLFVCIVRKFNYTVNLQLYIHSLKLQDISSQFCTFHPLQSPLGTAASIIKTIRNTYKSKHRVIRKLSDNYSGKWWETAVQIPRISP